ncbi:MAG: mechanosensitive ion channel [Solobacterium sp.]|nr:mechanosensitive ion channel [Solobacterium sp.]
MITLAALSSIIVDAVVKILIALAAYIVGKWIIGKLLNILKNAKAVTTLDQTVQSFVMSLARVILYVILAVTIIGVLGIPMASVITVLASAGVAVGMAMQGSLSNFAGGIMLMIFRPFSVGNYVSAAGAEGTVSEITPFYTVLKTVDNRTITIPNGSLMNTNVTNFSKEETRRVDLTFGTAKGEDIDKVTGIMLDVMAHDDRVLQEPAPFAKLSGGTNEKMEFTVRAWVNSADYWDVYFGLNEKITKALGEAGIKAPAARVIAETK